MIGRKYIGTKQERNKQAALKYRTAHKEKVLQINAISKRKSKFGLDLEGYTKLLTQQNSSCAICKQPESKLDYRTKKVKLLAVDHCHNSKKIRGLLCQDCNLGLGKFKDNTSFLQEALIYLSTHGDKV